MSTFKKKEKNIFRKYFDRSYFFFSPDSPEYLHVEEDEGESGNYTGDHQPGPVYVEPGVRKLENMK